MTGQRDAVDFQTVILNHSIRIRIRSRPDLQCQRGLDAKAPADATAFKAWLKHVAEKVAEASTEGGFLGFGGVRVTDAEKASIAEVAQALGAR
jgi:hypothetical protein